MHAEHFTDSQPCPKKHPGQWGYDIYSVPYLHGTVTDVVWSMFNLSHGPAYHEAPYIMQQPDRRNPLYLVGHSGGCQRSAVATRILTLHGYHVKKVFGVAGPSIGRAYIDSDYPSPFRTYLNSEKGMNQDIVSQAEPPRARSRTCWIPC